MPNLFERNDGIDTVDWIIHQPWCDILGYWGMSYTSMAGWAIADTVAGKVASMYLSHYGTDRFASAYEKGCFHHDVLTSWSMDNGPAATDCSYAHYLESCRYMPQCSVDEVLWGCRNDSYREYIKSPNFQDPLWQSGWWKQLREIPEKTVIPICLVSGWYDHHHGSSMKTWEKLSEKAKSHSQLIIGAWNHFMTPVIPGRESENLHPQEIPPMVAWFERTLKQKKEPKRKVRCYIIGEDCWIEADAWRKPNAQNQKGTIRTGHTRNWYLQAAPAPEGYSGWLLPEQPKAQKTKELCYTFNPANPVPSVGGESLFKTIQQAGSLPQPEPGYRPDVLSFLSEPLTEDMRISGKIYVSLYVRSDCEDTAFTAKLIDVMPDGTAYHIRSSITTISQDLPEGETYTPGETSKVKVSMWDIVYTVKAGHSLRLDISSSNFPQFHIHSNHAGLWSTQIETKLARQTILMGGTYVSGIFIEQ